MTDPRSHDDKELEALRREALAREQAWGELEEILRRAVTRLAVLASEAAPEIEDALDELREAVRAGADARDLGQRLERIERAARGGGEGSRAHSTGASSTVLKELLGALRAPPGDDAPLLELRRSAEDVTDDGSLAQLLERVTTELNRLLERAAAGDTLARQALSHLLERVPLSGELAARAETLRDRLAQGHEGEALRPVVRAMGELLASAQLEARGEREALETFLRHIDEELRGLMAGIEGADRLRRESLASGRSLGEALQNQFGRMRAELRDADGLDGYQQAIDRHLEELRECLARHRDQENERSAAAESQIRELSARVATLESEGGKLREHLHDARRRMHVDSLTGIANRLGYEAFFEQEYGRWHRYRTPLSLVLLDIDHFKRINDRYGHKAGDKVLKAIASRLSKHVREPDCLARYGGEEFILLMPETDRMAARKVAEKLRQSVESMGFTYEGEPVRITVSAGLTEFEGEDSGESAFTRADAALYRAKDAGRNRCEFG